MDWRTEENFLKGIGDIVNTSQRQHAEEMKFLNNQHKEEIDLLNNHHKKVVQELSNQAQSAEVNHNEAIKEARLQVTYARRAFIVALIALAVTIGLGVFQYLHCK